MPTPIIRLTPSERAACEAIKVAIASAKPRVTMTELAAKIGTTYSKLSNITNERTKPTREIIDQVRMALGLPQSWPDVPTDKLDNRKVSLSGTPLVPIRVLTRASAGNGVWDRDTDQDVAYVPERLTRLGDIAVWIDGDSMMDHLAHGDAAVFKSSSDKRNGFIYLVHDDDGDYLVKILEYHQGDWMLVSYNPKYPPIPLGNKQVLGLFMGFYRVDGTREIMDSDSSGLRFSKT